MNERVKINLATSLHGIAVTLFEVAGALASLDADGELEQQAKLLDRIAEDASDSASILRALTDSECGHELPAQPEPRDAADVNQAQRPAGLGARVA